MKVMGYAVTTEQVEAGNAAMTGTFRAHKVCRALARAGVPNEGYLVDRVADRLLQIARKQGRIATTPTTSASGLPTPEIHMTETENVPEWAILDNYRYEPVEVVRETAATVFYKVWNRDRTDWQERRTSSALPWRGTEAEAAALSAKLESAKAEYNRRTREARVWFDRRVAELARKDSQ